MAKGMTRRTRIPSQVESDAGDGMAEEAIQRWRTAIRSTTVGRYHYEMGLELQAAGYRESARAAFRRASEADPGNYSAIMRLAGLPEGDGESAAISVTGLPHPDDPDTQACALAEEAEDSLNAGRTEEALSLMSRALAAGGHIAAHRPDAVVTLAGALGNQHEEALRWCDQAAPYASNLYALHHQRGFSLLLLDRQEEAKRELLASILAAPARNLPSWYVLGQYHRLRFEAGPALAAYGRVRDSAHPLRRWAGLMIASTLLLEGRLHEALESCNLVLTDAPDMTAALAIRGLVRLHAEDLAAAARDIAKARRTIPEDPCARTFDGLVKLVSGRPDEALRDLQDGRGDFACLALPRLGRARAMLELGDRKEAGRLVRAAMAEERLWIAATLRLLGPLGDSLIPFLDGTPHETVEPTR